MKISGFTFVRNAVKLNYPVVESIRSALPIVDEFVVCVGDSDDDTLGLIRSIDDPKVRIVESKWNPNIRKGGFVLAQQTNIALFNCTGHWAIYLQADELIHERDHDRLVKTMQKFADDSRVDGLAMRRRTFYGDYSCLIDVYPMHDDLIARIVKPHHFVLSRGDAAGFTVHPKYKEKGRLIRLVDSATDLFHYGDIRNSDESEARGQSYAEMWERSVDGNERDYYTEMPRQFVCAYNGSHPAPIQDRIAAHAVPLDLESPRWRHALTRREKILLFKTRLSRQFRPWFRSGRSSARMIRDTPPMIRDTH
ncbi:MAG: glycosyltransferase [Fimbriimonadaceae bacterium]|nr:glycosyltransferase [Alphaproteobacteria bacterium]